MVTEYKSRIQKVREWMEILDIPKAIITPGANLRYLTGYKAKNLERLTCLVIDKKSDSFILVPKLEKLATIDSNIELLDIEVRTWDEDENPYEKINQMKEKQKIAIDPEMNASKLLSFQSNNSDAMFVDARIIMNPIRSIKSLYEISQLVYAGKLIDSVHQKVPELVTVGETERSVANKIRDEILSSGHEKVDFVIVASGENSASPHHEPSDRRISNGDVLVIDIGGTTPSGYCSDSTRTYVFGNCPPGFQEKYEILKQAQELSIESVKEYVSADKLDSVARDYLTKHDLGEYFIHRTGHGIGMETHEEPYIVQSNSKLLMDGNSFSIEPGFYIEGKYGARIEDIVVKNDLQTINCNNSTKELVFI